MATTWVSKPTSAGYASYPYESRPTSAGYASFPVKPAYNTTSKVLGTSTAYKTATTSSPAQQSSTPQQQNEADMWAERARAEIEGGYSNYFAELDKMLNEGLPAQQTAQEGIANSQYTQGLNTLTGQKTEGLADLSLERGKTDESQGKTLRDLSSNLRNSFMAGNVYLGARGAGDSSAADQYAYALTKMGSQQRGDIMGEYAKIQNEIANREFKLKNIFNTEVKNLEASRDEKIMEVASWFAEQQNQLRLAKGQGQLAKGQDLASLSQTMLNQALTKLNFITQEASNKKTALEQWAMNNSTNIKQLASNMQAVSTYNPTMPTAQPITGTPSMASNNGLYVPSGYGGSQDEEKKSIWG